MKRAALLLSAAVLLYFGGMYRAAGFVFAAAALLVLVLVLPLLLLPVRKRAEVRIVLPETPLRHGTSFACTLRVLNPTPLPAPRAVLTVSCDGKEQTCTAPLPAKGEAQIEIPVTVRYCGVFTISVKKIAVWDMLCIGPLAKPLALSERRVILPESPPLQVRFLQSPALAAADAGIAAAGDGPPPEIRDLTSYRPGDAMRDIHWKLSASRDTLLTRRYSLETAPRLRVFWDGFSPETPSPARADAFWSLCFSVSLGLLAASEAPHYISWYDADRAVLETRLLSAPGDLLDAMTERLLGTALFPAGDRPELLVRAFWEAEAAGETVVSVNTALELRTRQAVLFAFHEDRYEQELQENAVSL